MFMVVESGLLGFRVLVHWKSHQITCDRNAHFYKYLVEISLSNISNLITMTLWRSMSILLSVTFEFDKRKMKPFFAFLWFQSSWERIDEEPSNLILGISKIFYSKSDEVKLIFVCGTGCVHLYSNLSSTEVKMSSLLNKLRINEKFVVITFTLHTCQY